MRTVPDKPLHRALTRPLEYLRYDGTMGQIPVDFKSDGSSTPWLFQGLFPRHQHPIAFFRHDWRCREALCPKERLFADQQFEIDVGQTSWWITKKLGYLGVRVGAHLGIGRYKY